jgi:hypothetical protein
MEPSSINYTEESTLLDEVIKWMEPLRRYGIVVLKIRDRYALGYSDLFICARGRFIVAELKDDVGKPSIHQDDFINLMTRADASGGICRSVKDVADLISEALYCTCGSQASTRCKI